MAELPHLARLLLLLRDPRSVEIGQRRGSEISPRERTLGSVGHVGPGTRTIAGSVGQGRGLAEALGPQWILCRAELRRAAIQPGRVAPPALSYQPAGYLMQTVRLDRADDGW